MGTSRNWDAFRRNSTRGYTRGTRTTTPMSAKERAQFNEIIGRREKYDKKTALLRATICPTGRLVFLSSTEAREFTDSPSVAGVYLQVQCTTCKLWHNIRTDKKYENNVS